MGGTNWNDQHYVDKQQARKATGQATFAYSAAVAAMPYGQQKVHPTLDPKGVKVRESRDSDAHPESRAVAVFLDQTGSLKQVPALVQAKLPQLMGLLIRKGYIQHPQIMVGAIGDANTDRAILQVGQFESGIEIENDITNIWLEGNGGGQMSESHELAIYFLARHTSIDCFEKRSQKGYVFIISDEMAYDTVSRSQVEGIIGDTLETDLRTADVLKELQTRYEVFYILPNMTSYYDEPIVLNYWRELLGERVLKLEDPNGVCELIASTIALCEGAGDRDSVCTDLVDIGTAQGTVNAVSKALAPIKATAKGAVATIPDSGADSGIAVL